MWRRMAERLRMFAVFAIATAWLMPLAIKAQDGPPGKGAAPVSDARACLSTFLSASYPARTQT